MCNKYVPSNVLGTVMKKERNERLNHLATYCSKRWDTQLRIELIYADRPRKKVPKEKNHENTIRTTAECCHRTF